MGEIINVVDDVSVELLSNNEFNKVYYVRAMHTEKLKQGDYKIAFLLINPETKEPLNILSVSGVGQEFAGGLPWLGDDKFTSHGVSWNSKQIPLGFNLMARMSFIGIPVFLGFEGIVIAKN